MRATTLAVFASLDVRFCADAHDTQKMAMKKESLSHKPYVLKDSLTPETFFRFGGCYIRCKDYLKITEDGIHLPCFLQ